MEAKLVSISGMNYWLMPEGTFLRARDTEMPWAILIKTPEGTRPLRRQQSPLRDTARPERLGRFFVWLYIKRGFGMMTHDKLSRAICRAFDPFALFPPDIPVWVVGGAVRDLILKKDPHDWDLVVDLDINGIKDLTGGSVVGPRGKQVCVFSHSHRILDVASMVGGSITADLARRDFTVNAMALGRGWSIVDPFCGEEDLLHRRLRFVPELEDRLTEDPVRAIRFCRFSATLGLSPMEDEIKRLKAFVRKNRKNLNSIHPQRIGREMVKGLVFPNAFLWLLSDVGLVEMVLPEFKSSRVKDLPEGPLSLALSIGLLSFAQSRCDWHSLLISWGVPSRIKRGALLLGLVLSSLSLPLGMDGICDLILNFGTSWRRDLQGLVKLGYADNDIFRDNLRQIDLALLRLSDAERAGIPLTGGDVAAEIGTGPHVRVCLDRLMRYALSEEKPSLERAMDIISLYRQISRYPPLPPTHLFDRLFLGKGWCRNVKLG